MPMSTISVRALTVLVAPHARTDEIVAVLADYSAVGLLAGFAWVDAADVGGASTPATLVRDGRSEPVVLQRLLTTERYDRIRLAVLVPIDAAPAERVPLVSEQTVEQIVRGSSMGARISLLRLLLTQGDTARTTPDPTLVLEGWHNLLVAPEDSAGPGLGAVPWGPMTDPLDFGSVHRTGDRRDRRAVGGAGADPVRHCGDPARADGARGSGLLPPTGHH